MTSSRVHLSLYTSCGSPRKNKPKMYDRKYSASLVIGCEGKSEPQVEQTYFGEMRSRSGANLKYVINDAKKIFEKWSTDNELPNEAHICLQNPDKKEVIQAIQSINKILSEYNQEQTGLDVFFAGHGEYGTGSLVMNDDTFSAEELIYHMSENLDSSKGERGLSFFLDSCYSGSFLIETILTSEKSKCPIRLFDAKVSSLPKEKSWELSFLEHGAYTFTFLNEGNAYVPQKELTKAIEKQDHALVAKYIQGMVAMISSPVAFLTQGKQHSIDCMKGYIFSVEGYGDFTTAEFEKGELSKEVLLELFEKAKNSIWES